MNRFNIIRIVGIFFFITGCCFSCETPVHEELQILIQNRTDSPIDITLYPKGDVGGLYPVCEGCGGHGLTEFSLSPNNGMYEWKEAIFITGDVNMKPYTLASNAFDSIHIRLANKNNITIKFTHETVTGYSENIFSEDSTWEYKIVELDRSDFRARLVNAHCYTFLILEDKIIKKEEK